MMHQRSLKTLLYALRYGHFILKFESSMKIYLSGPNFYHNIKNYS